MIFALDGNSKRQKKQKKKTNDKQWNTLYRGFRIVTITPNAMETFFLLLPL